MSDSLSVLRKYGNVFSRETKFLAVLQLIKSPKSVWNGIGDSFDVLSDVLAPKVAGAFGSVTVREQREVLRSASSTNKKSKRDTQR